MIFDRHIAAYDVAGLTQALMERAQSPAMNALRRMFDPLRLAFWESLARPQL